MRKLSLKIAITFFLTSILFTSCEKNEEIEKENCTGENYAIEVSRFLKKITTHAPGQVIVGKEFNYSYNEFNLLLNKNEINNSVLKNNYSYSYICANNLNEIENINSNSDVYKFDLENRLISFNTSRTFNEDYRLTYKDNLITVEHRENGTETLILEINARGLVTKLTRESGYSTTFEYDTYGNIIKVQDFYIDGTFERGYEIIYDQNPNPFYGQLSSIYLERFISYFDLSSNGIVNMLFRKDGYNFPYFKNNPVSIKYLNASNGTVLTREYEYDNQNYPVKISESFEEENHKIIYRLVYR